MDVHSLIAVDSGWRQPRTVDLPLPNAQVSGPNPPPPNNVTITVNVMDALGLTEVGTVVASIGTVTPPTLITIGNTNIGSTTDGGNGNILTVQKAVLPVSATIQSLSFYVQTAGGNLRLGVYDASGSGGNPGKLITSAAAFTPVLGWNTVTVPQVHLASGTYWLAYLPQSNSLAFPRIVVGGNAEVDVNFTYAALPATFPTSGLRTGGSQWSFYATLQE